MWHFLLAIEQLQYLHVEDLVEILAVQSSKFDLWDLLF